MNKRPTSETDALHEIRHSGWRDIWSQYFEMLNLSRRLERERDDLIDRLTALEHSMPIELAKLERERDEAREELDELNKRLIEASQRGIDLLIEREDLRKEVAAERALADRLADAVACLSAETTQGYEHIQSAFDAWKEARK